MGGMFRFINHMMRGLAAAGAVRKEDAMITIDSELALEACLSASEGTPLFLLKHSTRCPISSNALDEVRDYVEGAGEAGAPVYINYVVENRAISNQLAEVLGIRHESPQLFLIAGTKVVWHASHGGITQKQMTSALRAEKRKS